MAIDPIAGEIHPSSNGACDYFVDDGRSDVCVSCDHHSYAHSKKALRDSAFREKS